MANVIITLKIMPESIHADLNEIEKKVLKEIKKFAGETETKSEIELVAFGLKALKLIFVMDEDKGSTEALENKINKIKNINSIEVVDVRRAIG
jgi:elongation factor 1-beta